MNILFVEDNAMNRRIVGEMLRAAGLAMDEAEDAAAGLDLIERKQYDLVLMDIRMPGMDGLAATEMIRARADEKAATPVVVITADTAPNLREECLRRGADGFLTKPVIMDNLFDVIGQVLAAGGGEMVLA